MQINATLVKGKARVQFGANKVLSLGVLWIRSCTSCYPVSLLPVLLLLSCSSRSVSLLIYYEHSIILILLLVCVHI